VSRITKKKWKQIGRICGYDGTRTASVWSEDADRLRRACPYELWKKMAQVNLDSPFRDQESVVPPSLRGDGDPREGMPWEGRHTPGKAFMGTAYRDGGGWTVKSESGEDFKVTNPQILFDALKSGGENMSSFEFNVYCYPVAEGRCKVAQIK
jgi:hypothetical protein